MIKIKDISVQIRGVSYKPTDLHENLNDNSVMLLRANNIENDKINFNDVIYVDKSKVSSSQYLKIGDILICTSSGSKNLVGKSAIIDKEIIATFGAFCKVIRPRNVYPYYLGHYFTSTKYRSIISQLSAGANINNIRNEHIDSLEIYFPPLEIQRQIADNLDKVTHIIDLCNRILEKLDLLVKSRFVEMFGDMELNPNEWDKVSLGSVCDVRDGTHDSPKYFDKGYPLVTSKNVTSGKISFSDCNLICEEDYNKINERSKVDYGDIIMPMIGTVGKPVIVNVNPEFAIKNVALIKFYANFKVINTFINILLQSDYFNRTVKSRIRGGTQKFIALGDIRNLEFCLPPLELQQQFASFVEKNDKTKAAVQKALDEAQLLFDSLMQEYFG